MREYVISTGKSPANFLALRYADGNGSMEFHAKSVQFIVFPEVIHETPIFLLRSLEGTPGIGRDAACFMRRWW
jgi:hypothetical protein